MTQKVTAQGHVAWADGQKLPVATEHSAEELLHQFCGTFGVNMATALEMFEWIDENGHRPRENAAAAGASAAKYTEWLREFLIALVAYQDRQRDADHLPAGTMIRMSTRCAALALNFRDIAGAKDSTELAQKMGLQRLAGGSGKATVNKCLKYFQKVLRLLPIPGQRGETARVNMSNARKGQLKPPVLRSSTAEGGRMDTNEHET